MEYKTAMEKMTFLMCGDDLCRIRTEQDEDGIVKVIIDLHGMSKRNAIRMITNIMVLFRFKFRLEVVHGYNHGTAIKEYIYNELINSRIISKVSPTYNPGITDLMIAGV